MAQKLGEIYKNEGLKDLLEDCKKKAEKVDIKIDAIFLPREVFNNASQEMRIKWNLQINQIDTNVVEISGTMRYMI